MILEVTSMEWLGKEYELADVQKPENEFMEELKAIVEKEGLTCKIGG